MVKGKTFKQITDDPYRNLVCAVIRQAVEDGDRKWLIGVGKDGGMLKFWLSAAGLDLSYFRSKVVKSLW